MFGCGLSRAVVAQDERKEMTYRGRHLLSFVALMASGRRFLQWTSVATFVEANERYCCRASGQLSRDRFTLEVELVAMTSGRGTRTEVICLDLGLGKLAECGQGRGGPRYL